MEYFGLFFSGHIKFRLVTGKHISNSNKVERFSRRYREHLPNKRMSIGKVKCSNRQFRKGRKKMTYRYGILFY